MHGKMVRCLSFSLTCTQLSVHEYCNLVLYMYGALISSLDQVRAVRAAASMIFFEDKEDEEPSDTVSQDRPWHGPWMLHVRGTSSVRVRLYTVHCVCGARQAVNVVICRSSSQFFFIRYEYIRVHVPYETTCEGRGPRGSEGSHGR